MVKKKSCSVLVVGGDSAIGSALAKAYCQEGARVWTTTRRETELTNRRCYLDLGSSHLDFVLPIESIDVAFLCAAVTSQEKCRSDPERSREVNVVMTLAIAERLISEGVFVVMLSSNAVFDGESAFAKISDFVTPKSVYGSQKAEVEKSLLSLGGHVAIVRFGKVISPYESIFLKWKRDVIAGKIIYPFSDLVMAPLPLHIAVSVLKRVGDTYLSGIVQATARHDITYLQAAQYLVMEMQLNADLISPISCLEAGILSPPRNTTLDSELIKEAGIPMPTPYEAIRQFI